MRITVFADVDISLNPYVLLSKQSLERQGFTLYFERRLSLSWLFSKGKHTDAIHLQWINQAFTPSKKIISSGPFRKLAKHRFGNALLEALRLTFFSITLLFARFQGKIIVYTVHDLNEFGEKSWRDQLQFKLAHYIVFSLSHHIHVHNDYSRRFIETHFRGKYKITVVRHGNYIEFYPNKVSKAEARRQLKLPHDSFVFLFLGLLRPYKGLEDLVNAFRMIESPHARLLIAGRVFSDTKFKVNLFNLASKDSRIKLVPKFIPDKDIQLFMKSADVCVLPYKVITTSGAAALALTFGKPIIAPDFASFPELIFPDTGILYSNKSQNALYDALREAMRRSWSESKIIEYAHEFDWHKIGTKLAKLYT